MSIVVSILNMLVVLALFAVFVILLLTFAAIVLAVAIWRAFCNYRLRYASLVVHG